MYICICKGVTDHHIKQAVVQGAHDFEAIKQKFGLTTACGRCEVSAREVFQIAVKSEERSDVCAAAS
jgi:bacterioferritin-associated ferredoxin